MNGKQKIGAAALAFVISASALTVPAAAKSYKTAERTITHSIVESERAVTQRPGATRWEKYITLDTVQNKNVWSYTRKNIKIGNAILSVKSVKINGEEYLPTRAAASALGLTYTYTSSTRTVNISGKGLNMTFSDGCYVTYANDRALFSMTPAVILSDGRMYLPANVFLRAVGMTKSEGVSQIEVRGTYNPIVHASKYYRNDEVFWLARIIEAEAAGEPLLGKIAVGNVVLNRVKSNYYPNTIYGVIFDKKYGVQFSPVLDGSIYNTPGFNSTLAAKICLEGSDVSDGVFFFLRPEMSTSSWIPNNRTYAYSIGRHDFYY